MRTLSVLISLATLFALCAAQQTVNGNHGRENAFSKIVPRLLWNIKRGEHQESHRNTQQPIIIVQQPSPSSDHELDRHHHHHNPHYPYYPYYQPPPPPPSRPPPQFPGMEYLNSAGGGPTYLIINPNNMQGIYLPASSSNSSNSTSSRRSAFVPSIADLLQGLSLDDLADGSLFENDSEVVDAAEDGIGAPSSEDSTQAVQAAQAVQAVQAAQTDDDREEDEISEDVVEAVERQTNRGLSPKQLVSIIMQDKRRRRIQEVLAGIYLRNYSLNRK
ncbi:transcription factor Sox-1 [Drosophila elegans]|uniref:transcription factor Sox-1 n=1 Tax=Drosophila elegans TaxID=30023 RepID=UPI0007E74A1C|nr:transcription factor Sox-1 [Drosophila elegans]